MLLFLCYAFFEVEFFFIDHAGLEQRSVCFCIHSIGIKVVHYYVLMDSGLKNKNNSKNKNKNKLKHPPPREKNVDLKTYKEICLFK